MQHNLMQRTIAASHRELDTKLELLQQLGYGDRFFLDDDASISDIHPKDEDTARWIQAECNWAMEEAAADIPDLFDVAEDEEACPFMYDPTFFSPRQSSPPTQKSRSDSLSKAIRDDKPLPSVPPLKLRKRPSVPIVPPPSPAVKSNLSSPGSTPPASPRSYRTESRSPPPSPRLSRHSPRSHGSLTPPPAQRPSAQRHATYPSISSTLSLLEERETEAEKRSAVYVADSDGEPSSSSAPVPRPLGRGRSSSATVPRSGDVCGPLPISPSPRRKQRPALPALATSVSSPQLRRLAELASTPSPSFSVSLGSPLLPSPMSDATVTPETEIVSPGEAITYSPLENPADEKTAEPGLASRWSLDSVASRPRINQMALDDASSPPANKTKKRDRLLSLISPRARSGSVTKPFPPPNTPRGSSDILDIRRVDLRDVLSPSSLSSVTMPPKISMTPSMAPSLASSFASSDSSNTSSASTLGTPIEPTHPQSLSEFADPFASHSPSCMPEETEEEDSLVFAENPYYVPESPLLEPEFTPTQPSPSIQPQHLEAHPHEPLKLQIPERPMSPQSPPPQPTLPLPSPGTPSPSFLVPSPRPQSFFASITGRQRRRKKKLVISGAPLELAQSRSSSSVSNTQTSDDHRHRQAEQQRRVHNVVKWCESFGPVRKIETKDDGSLHVYWRDWEVADMVCRIQAQVVIKDVGRVNLAWYYIS
ncbi:hypothetical protein C8Q80DRAFT_1271394 [Daedaleopsis nitida]|nr:hypothetical protein C8Q80DRAFT_1271394 [Daedaleopsis nitida]